MRPAHTPGPWSHAGQGAVVAEVDGHKRQVACVTGAAAMHGPVDLPASQIRDANARLIAEAPEMLALLERAVAGLSQGACLTCDDRGSGRDIDCPGCAWISEAEDAILRARGE